MPDTNSPLSATLIELMELPGPTGQEEPVLAWCREHWAALGAANQPSDSPSVSPR